VYSAEAESGGVLC